MSDGKLIQQPAKPRTANFLEKAVGLKTVVEREPLPADTAPQPVGVPPTVVQQLVRWIPTETITLYVAWIALLDPVSVRRGQSVCKAGDFSAAWLTVAAFSLVTVLVVVAIYLAKLRATKQPFRWPVFEMSAATVAFIAWAFALPDTPLRDFCGYKVEIGAFIVLAVSVVIGLVAGATGHEPAPAPGPPQEQK